MFKSSRRKTRVALGTGVQTGGLPISLCAENMGECDDNMTRFVILSKSANGGRIDGPAMTTFLFEVKNVPAALYKAMGGFATNGVNMTKLESYQRGGSFAATEFSDDIEGQTGDPARSEDPRGGKAGVRPCRYRW